MSEPIPEGWITTAEAEEISEYTRAHLRYLASSGRIEAMKVGDRLWLINKRSLLKYQANVRPGRPRKETEGGQHQSQSARPENR